MSGISIGSAVGSSLRMSNMPACFHSSHDPNGTFSVTNVSTLSMAPSARGVLRRRGLYAVESVALLMAQCLCACVLAAQRRMDE